MASQEAIAIRHHEAITALVEVLERHDPELDARLRKANHGPGIPGPSKRPAETAAYHALCMASLARLVDQQLTRRPVGRPPKAS